MVLDSITLQDDILSSWKQFFYFQFLPFIDNSSFINIILNSSKKCFLSVWCKHDARTSWYSPRWVDDKNYFNHPNKYFDDKKFQTSKDISIMTAKLFQHREEQCLDEVKLLDLTSCAALAPVARLTMDTWVLLTMGDLISTVSDSLHDSLLSLKLIIMVGIGLYSKFQLWQCGVGSKPRVLFQDQRRETF